MCPFVGRKFQLLCMWEKQTVEEDVLDGAMPYQLEMPTYPRLAPRGKELLWLESLSDVYPLWLKGGEMACGGIDCDKTEELISQIHKFIFDQSRRPIS